MKLNFINQISQIIRLARRAFWPYKPQIAVLTLLGFVSGLLEGIGINALIPLFSFVIGNPSGGTDIVSRAIGKFFLFFNINFSVKYLLIFISALFVLKAAASVILYLITVRITTDYEQKTRVDLFDRTLRAGWPYLLRQKVGYLETVLMTDIQYASSLLSTISGSIMMLTGLVVYVGVAVNISFSVTMFTLALGALIFIGLRPLVSRTKAVAKAMSQINKNIAHYVNENILGMKAVKTMFAQKQVSELGGRFFHQLRNLKLKVSLFTSLSGGLLQPIGLIFICVVFAFSYKSPGFNFAALVAIIYLIQRIFMYLQQLQGALQKATEAIPYLVSVLEYQQRALDNQEKISGGSRFEFREALEFKNVNFSYQPSKEVLANVSFCLKKGEMVGLIGPSGVGKTTIVDLILRLFNPLDGVILLDGKPISEIDMKEWRKNIGYVSQDMFLMNETITNNIKFYDDSLSDADIEQAARMAQIYDFVQSCPDKFSTVLGERGILLSMGQRQRIIIARILARKPQLLILDEATSALDNESEAKVQAVIQNLKGKVTVLAVAHRLSTLLNSDRILVIDQGKIIEEGAPGELLKDKNSYFYRMHHIRK